MLEQVAGVHSNIRVFKHWSGADVLMGIADELVRLYAPSKYIEYLGNIYQDDSCLSIAEVGILCKGKTGFTLNSLEHFM